MAKVKLDFKRLPIAEKIVRAQQIVKNLTGNPDFPTPNSPLAQITASTNALGAKDDALVLLAVTENDFMENPPN